ncbi:lethal(3)malignant brain tumor-like protein 3 isoform X2 [Uranotaenia lowii]|nr:lethal(3)malignant brain tumor-like protein 3 isoform X2 [Uranotaenia lowii]XP_055602715.1 lethal(3)malignant brain tumor-like protein 3 isoform X2 [Uranotaenia lowii]
MHTPGFKLQIGNTNIMSLQQKVLNPVTQQQQLPQTVTMIQPSTATIIGSNDLKRLSPSIKILKPIAPKPIINSYTSTVIKPAPESNIQPPPAAASSVCHHVLPFGTTIKVTASNEQMQIPATKSQQIIQPLVQTQPPQPPIVTLPQQPPPSPQTTTLLRQIRPVSPATQQSAGVQSPNQNKVIFNKLFYKAPENQLGPAPTAGQPRIVPVTPPLSPVSVPQRKIIITAPGASANRKRMLSPATQTSARSTQVLVTPTVAPMLPALVPHSSIEHIPPTIQTMFPSGGSSSSGGNITVTPVVPLAEQQQPLVAFAEEKPQSSAEDLMVQQEIPESSEPDEELNGQGEELKVTQSHGSSLVDMSETEVSSTTTEHQTAGEANQEEDRDYSEEEEDDDDDEEQLQIDTFQSSQESTKTDNTYESSGEQIPEIPNAVPVPMEQNDEPLLQTPTKDKSDALEDLWTEQMKSPRLQKRANSDNQMEKSPPRARRLSELPKQEEDGVKLAQQEQFPPMPKPLSVIKKSKMNRASKSTINSSLLCNEKFEMESDESRSLKTSASSINTISPLKKEETGSNSPPAFDQDKLQAAIEMYKKTQAMVKNQTREKRRSDSKSVAEKEEKEEKDYIEGDYGSTPSDLIKWDDGIGYIRGSFLHFQFNQFGLVEPMENKEYLSHVKTNVYESLKDPLGKRTVAAKTNKKKRKVEPSELNYKCRGCRCRGSAGDFATPDYCSVACMKQTKNETLLSSINRSKTLQRKGIASSESEMSNYTPLPTSDDDSLGSSLNFANAFKERANLPTKDIAVPIKQENTQETSTQPKFVWETYLTKVQGTPSPLNLFVNPYPTVPNKFRPGMKLEAIDPENNSLFCVCSIAEVRGYRLRLTFDGYSREYDFWVNADSLDIFPPGWCRKTGRVLQPPRDYEGDFNWMEYLNKTRSTPASRDLFHHLKATTSNNRFEIGMCLEADDLKKSGKVCVASVSDKIDNRILVHFDGWDERYDYWVDIRSPYIHHINWHKENGYNITAPPDWNKADFDWAKYIRLKSRRICKAIIPADKSLFATRDPFDFKTGMKLEVVDRKNQMLIRPATVVATDGYEIKVCFDGWPNFFSFWIEDDSSDIHPMNWCKRTTHPIEFPHNFRPASIKSTCEAPYCLGQGNAKIPSNRTHTRLAECPYRTNNWLSEDRKKLRLTHTQILTANTLRQSNPSELAPPPVKKIKKEPEELQAPTAIVQSESAITLITNNSAASVPAKTIPDPFIKTALPVISDFGPRLKQSYKLWRQSSRVLDRCAQGAQSEFDRNPLRWAAEEVACYVERFPGCAVVGNLIREEQIDGAAFLSLTQEDLVKYLDVKLGPAIKLYNRIIHLRLEVEKHFLKF